MRELCSIKPQELHLLPFYARIAASISRIFATVGETISQAAESQFNLLKVSWHTGWSRRCTHVTMHRWASVARAAGKVWGWSQKSSVDSIAEVVSRAVSEPATS